MGGTATERADVGALRAAVYRPGATGADVAALRRALDEQRAPETLPEVDDPTPPAIAASGDVPGAEAARSGDRRGSRGADAPRRSERQVIRGRWVALAALATIVAGAAAGAALVLLARPSTASAAVPTTVHISTTAGDAVFERPQRASDRPAIPLDPALVPSSVRRLLTAGRIQLYAARDVHGRRCLLGVQGGAVMSCVAPARFRRSGLLLLWSSDVLAVDPAGLRELRFRLALVADWRTDGRVTLGVVHR